MPVIRFAEIWVGCLLVVGSVGAQLHALDSPSDWAEWRGVSGNGSSPDAKPPITWSESENIAWKLDLAGKGHATPIVSKGRVYISSAIPVGPRKTPVYNSAPGAHDNYPVDQEHRFVVTAIDALNGKKIWESEVARALPHEGGHYTGSLASHSPLTDGTLIFAFFGSRGLHALDLSGKVVWKREIGTMATRHAHGEGASPALEDGVLVVNWDHEQQSLIVAYEASSGKELWRLNRDEMTSWSTPLIVAHQGSHQVIVSATKRVRSYNLRTGELVWECSGLARNVVASPVHHEGVVVVGNSYDKQAMMAIRLEGASGDISGSPNILWSTTRMTPYVPSPLMYKGVLYFLRHNQAVLSCLDPLTGKDLRGPFRLGGLREIFASPVAADDRVYIVGKSGATLVFGHGAEPRVLALNKLEDQFSASPAMVGDALFLRGEKFLYCLREQ